MASASNSAGFVGKWGQASYMPINSSNTKRTTPKKFFRSKNVENRTDLTPVRMATTPKGSKFATPMSVPRKASRENRKCSVAVRVRPLLHAPSTAKSVTEVNDAVGELYLPEFGKTYGFDTVFNEDTSQTSVYAVSAQPAMKSFISGTSAAILAYGQTGAGKTFTMGTDCSRRDLGDDDACGIIPRVVRDVFRHVEESADCSEYTIKVSFFEILNEKIFDLLKTMKVPLALKEAGTEFYIPDLKCAAVATEDEAITLLEHGCKTRATGATAQNAHSSRSHAVFRIALAHSDPETGETAERRISLVDLAGSESSAASAPEFSAERRQEGVNINKGLSVLNRCIAAICNREKHVPFRDSVLTKVLRDCLTGNGTTAMIACISPAADDVKETVNTLRYADFVKRMEKPEMPEHLSFSRLKILPPTPASFSRKRELNHTIETPTPTKRRALTDNSSNARFKMNKSASDLPKFQLETIRDVSDDMELSDSVSDISSIAAHNASSLSSSVAGPSAMSSSSVANLSVVEARSVLSPMMRSLKDEIKKHIEDTIKDQLEASILMTAKKAKRTPRKTSSPVRRSPRLAERIDDEDDDSQNDLDDTIISGVEFARVRNKMREAAGAVVRNALGDVTNAKVEHKKRVEEAASPMLPRREDRGSDKENPAVPPSLKKLSLSSRTETPPLSEMEKTLGLNSDSPLMLFGCDSPRRCSTSRRPAAPGTVKRSARRTTMLQPELNQSLMVARQSFSIPTEDAAPVVRRSKRISMLPPPQPIAMGPPAAPGPRVHPLEVRSHWSATDQQEHNSLILGILNAANIGMLQKLPGIGPKTAIKLHTQRDFQNGFKNVEDLKHIEGLSKTFFEKFCIKNQIVLK